MQQEPTWPGSDLVAITKSDSTVYAPPIRQIYVGTAGDISVTTEAGTTVLHKGCIAGSYIGPFYVSKVNSTGTTAADLVGYL
jgi:hypothetical protein